MWQQAVQVHLSAMLESYIVVWPLSADSAPLSCMAADVCWIPVAALCQERLAVQGYGWQTTSAI